MFDKPIPATEMAEDVVKPGLSADEKQLVKLWKNLEYETLHTQCTLLREVVLQLSRVLNPNGSGLSRFSEILPDDQA